MAILHRARDNALIDALENLHPAKFEGHVWRVVREGKEVLTPSSVGGRWDDATFDVLYTSQTADGATAEMHFHLARGQPVFPSKVAYRLYQLHVDMGKVLQLADLDAISRLGVDTSRYGALSYSDRTQEYPRTQEIAEASHFVGFDGLMAPNARWPCLNMIVFSDRVKPEACDLTKDHGRIDWNTWLKKPYGF